MPTQYTLSDTRPDVDIRGVDLVLGMYKATVRLNGRSEQLRPQDDNIKPWHHITRHNNTEAPVDMVAAEMQYESHLLIILIQLLKMPP